MDKTINSFSFLTIGKTAETKTTEFKRYIGLGQSDIIALNPTKKQLEEIYGHEVQNDPQYFGTDEQTGVKWARLDFIVKTVPEACNGIDMTTKVSFFIRGEKYSNREGTKVRVIDAFGNSLSIPNEDAENHTPQKISSGGNAKIAQFRTAYRGEPEVIDFLRKYLNIPDAFDYVNNSWILKTMKHENEITKDDAENNDVLVYEDHMLAFDKNDFVNFFKGNTSTLWEAIEEKKKKSLTPLAVTLLYGVKTGNDGKLFQAVCTDIDRFLYKNPNAKAISKLESDIIKAKQYGRYSNIDYRVQELQEYSVEPTNLDTPATSNQPFPSSNSSAWDAIF